MVITDKKKLERYAPCQRIWQGIPSIEVTNKGRIFIAFYSGGIKEGLGNYCLLLSSDDGGLSFKTVACASEGNKRRCFDPSLWIDPLGRLWFSYTVGPNTRLKCEIFDDVDGDLRYLGTIMPKAEVMINKPIVASWGEWLFPTYIFAKDVIWSPSIASKTKDRRCFVLATSDNGKTFVKRAGIEPPNRLFDEMVLLEHNDHHLSAFTRTRTGISHCESFDKGFTWTKPIEGEFKSPSSRFQFGRLRSGRLIQINHFDFYNRNNLTVLLSDDDGKTWPHKLLLDYRDEVSYPDFKEAEDGFIYICYDRERGGFKYSLKEALRSAREILMAKITEDDVIAGKLVNPKSRLKMIVSKLGEYKGTEEELFKIGEEADNPSLLVRYLDRDLIVRTVYERHSSCMTMLTKEEAAEVDRLSAIIEDESIKDMVVVIDAVDKLIRFLKRRSWEEVPGNEKTEIIKKIKKVIDDEIANEGLSVDSICHETSFSRYYLMHVFKQQTGQSILTYIDNIKLKKAKELLETTDLLFSEVGLEIGITDSAYLSCWFKKKTGMTMKTYRSLFHK